MGIAPGAIQPTRASVIDTTVLEPAGPTAEKVSSAIAKSGPTPSEGTRAQQYAIERTGGNTAVIDELRVTRRIGDINACKIDYRGIPRHREVSTIRIVSKFGSRNNEYQGPARHDI
jgi:hypothetical protein